MYVTNHLMQTKNLSELIKTVRRADHSEWVRVRKSFTMPAQKRLFLGERGWKAPATGKKGYPRDLAPSQGLSEREAN